MNQAHMKITYFSTLYKRNVTAIVFGEIKFTMDGHIQFYSMGHGYELRLNQVKKIELIEDAE